MCVAHRSPPDEVASKIVLPSSDVDEYIELPLRRTISRIVNPEGDVNHFYLATSTHFLFCRSYGNF